MRKYALLKEPYISEDNTEIHKIMLYQAEEGCYLFMYSSPEADECVSERLYPSCDELYDEWNDLIDEGGSTGIDDPLPFCQHDAFIPLRVKGRADGKPEWGKYETLRDGKWVEYKKRINPADPCTDLS